MAMLLVGLIVFLVLLPVISAPGFSVEAAGMFTIVSVLVFAGIIGEAWKAAFGEHKCKACQYRWR